jgi:adenine phosphoribosyltransferase
MWHMKTQEDYKKFIRDVQDFPTKGVVFRDISPLLADRDAFFEASTKMAISLPIPQYYVGLDARGFLFASAMAVGYSGVVMCRKQGKLPGSCVSQTYSLEYGASALEMQRGVIPEGSSVIIVDDVLATGGTALCAVNLCRSLGLKVIGASFLIEVSSLGGKSVLEDEGVEVYTLLTY